MKNNKKIGLIALAIILIAGIIAILSTNFVKKVDNISQITDPETLRAMSYGELSDEDAKVDNCDYVQFSAFFTRDLNSDGYAERLKGTCKQIGQTDTLYLDLNVLTKGYLKNGRITLNGENFTWTTSIVNDNTFVDGNYIGQTSSIKLKDEIRSGSQKLFYGAINSKIGNNINNYSKVNTITLTGTYVDEDGNETPISKTANVTVDWYGITKTSINNTSQNYNIESLVNNEQVIVKFSATVEETARQLLLQKQIAEITIPELNGYSATDVKVTNSNVDYEYNEETGILTITREATVDENGNITSSVPRINTNYIEVTYPLESYTTMDANTVSLSIPMVGYNYGYNNTNQEFSNPYISRADSIVTVTYSEPRGDVWNVYTYVGDKIYVSGWGDKRVISKKPVMNIYTGNIYEDSIHTYPVEWKLITSNYKNLKGITLEEQATNKSDEFLDTAGKYTTMYDYIKTTGVYFVNAEKMFGTEGWIELYNAETGSLIEKFTSETWGNYSEEKPYEVDLKSIKIVTSAPVAGTDFSVMQIKVLDDELISKNYTQADFEKLSYVYTYLKGTAEAVEGVTFEDGKSTAEVNKSNYAYYEMPQSVQALGINTNKITNQETKNVNIYIETRSSNFMEEKWKDGVFLVELPENIISTKIKRVSITSSKTKILSYDVFEQNGKQYIKIYTSNEEEPDAYTITINADITPNPLKATVNQQLKLYAYNKNCDYYKYKIQDIFDIDNNGTTGDTAGYGACDLSIIAPSGLLTSEHITNYDDLGSMTVAPNIAEIDKSDNTRTTTVNVNVANNYSGTISEIKILGRTPFEGNTYIVNGESLNSTFTANMVGEINIPTELNGKVTIYYTEKENPDKDVENAENEWKLASEITDWKNVKCYLIDFGEYVLSKSEQRLFSYDVEIPANVKYNAVTFSDHAIYYCLDTEDGKLPTTTEPNKVGIQIVSKYDLELTKNKVFYENILVPGATYKVTTLDSDGNEISQTQTTNSEGKLKFTNLYIEREYTIKEISSPEDFVLDDKEIKFTAKYNDENKLVIEEISGEFVEILESSVDENGKSIGKVRAEDESKYKLIINKTGETGQILSNVRFAITGKGKNYKSYKTDETGKLLIEGLYLEEEYEIVETRADGYYVDSTSRKFKIVRNDQGILELETEDEILKNIKITETAEEATATTEITFSNEKIPTYNLQILKVEEDFDEENIENLKPLRGANFLFESMDTGIIKEFVTDENGYINIDNLYEYVEGKYILGEYTIKETLAPDGYANNAEEIKFKVSKNQEGTLEASIENKESLTTLRDIIVDGTTVKFVIQDKPLFTLTKVDSETGEVLANAKFIIYVLDENGKELDYAKDPNGNYIGEKNEYGEYVVTTDENGKIILPLPGGLYKAVEVGFPEGYQEKIEEQVFRVDDGKEDEEEEEEEEEEKTVVEINCIQDLVELSNSVNEGNTYDGTIVKLMRTLDFKDANSYVDETDSSRSATETTYGDLSGDGIIQGIMEELTDKNGLGFTPIGNLKPYYFSGIFDGQNYEIKNLYINNISEEYEYVGLFGCVKNAEIKNLGIVENIHKNNSNAWYTGGIASYVDGSSINNCYNKGYIENCSGGAYYNNQKLGGIAGCIYNSNIDNCYNEGYIYNKKYNCVSAGGIVGESNTSNIMNCYNIGVIENLNGSTGGRYTFYNSTGGIVGKANNGSNINSNYNKGDIINGNYIGGIIGYATAAYNIDNNYNAGYISKYNINKTQSKMGGIVGEAFSCNNISNNYNIGDINNTSESDCYTGGIVAYTTNTIIIKNFNTGKVISTSDRYSCAGGVVGHIISSSVNNNYNLGDISSKSSSYYSYAGGIVGEAPGISTSSTISLNISNGYSTGDIISSGTKSYAGGIIGNIYESEALKNCYYLDKIVIEAETIDNNGIATTDIDMKSREFYNILNVDEVWNYRLMDYPKLMYMPINLTSSTEITIVNTLKRLQITTDVKELNGVKGGTITGEDELPYETVLIGNNSTQSIQMTPESGYEIISITINGEPISYAVSSSGSYSIPAGYFTNMQEDKHIVVTYGEIGKNIVIKKADKDTNAAIAGTKFAIYKLDANNEIEDFAKDRGGNYVGTLNSEGIRVVETNHKGEITLKLPEGNYKAVEVEASKGYKLEENEAARTLYFDVVNTEIQINYIEDLVNLSNAVNSGTTYEGQQIELARTLDFNDASSYRNYLDTTTYGDYNGDGITEGIKEELTKASGSGFKTIGQNGTKFKGSFYGNGKEIKNVHITTWGGLFGTVSYGKICDLGLVGGKIQSSYPTGSIVADLENSQLINCYNTAEVYNSGAPAGGLVGLNATNSLISNCYNLGNVTCGNVPGGIVGYNAYNTTIVNCYNKGTITGRYNAAGITANLNSSKLINCYNEGNISGDGVVAGLTSSVNGTSYVSNCYSTGTITNENENAPSVGVFYASNMKDIVYNNCYYLDTSAKEGLFQTPDQPGKITAKTAEEMKSEEFVKELNENISDITADVDAATWIYEENGYPDLAVTKTNKMNSSNLIMTNKKAVSLIVHHYLKNADGSYTTKKVAEDELQKGYVGESYETNPHVDLEKITLEKDSDGNFVVPDNATGTYEEATIEVIYYYEPDDIKLTIHHYIDGTEEKLAEDKVINNQSVITFLEDGKYTVTTEGNYFISEDNNYKELIKDYKLTTITSTVKENVELTDNLTYQTDTEITYYYSLDEYTITTEVKPHEESRTDEVSNEKETISVDGGTVTGEYTGAYTEENKIKFVETVAETKDSKVQIIADPDENYRVKEITLVSTNEAGEKTESIIYGEEAIEDAEITYTEDEDGNVILTTFKQVTENKHIIVEFEPVLGKVIIHHYVEETGEEFGTDPVRVPAKVADEDTEEKVVEDEVKQDYVGEVYTSKQSDNVKEIYELVSVSGETSGEFINGEIHVYYYYSLKDYKYTIHYFYDGIEDTSKIENGEADYGTTITEYPNKPEEYTFIKVDPVNPDDSRKTNLTITEDESANVINVYYGTTYKITTNVIEHTEEYKDGTIEENVKGGEISGEDLTPYETVVKGEQPENEVKITPDAGYEIVKVIVKDSKDAETGITVDLSKIEKAEDGSIILPTEYLADPENGMQSDKHIEVEFRKISKVIVKHLEEGTETELAETQEITGYEGQEFETARKVITNYMTSNTGITDENIDSIEKYTKVTTDEETYANGSMYADTLTIIYWYELPEGIIVKHIEINEQDIKDGLTENSGIVLDEELFEGIAPDTENTSRKIYSEESGEIQNEKYKYYISVDGPQITDENVIIVGKDEVSKTVSYLEDSTVEVRYYYEKQHEVTTEVKPHIEIINGVETEKDGGTISKEYVTDGQGNKQETIYETINHRGYNSKEIEITPDKGYRAKQITIQDLSKNGDVISENIYGRIEFEEDSNHKIILKSGETDAYFKDVQNNKHVIVEFERIPAKVIVEYRDVVTGEIIPGTDTAPIEKFVGDEYETEPKDIEDYVFVEEKYPSNSKGIMTEEDITVVYWYTKEFKITTDVIEHTEVDKEGNVSKEKGGKITAEDEDPYEVVLRGNSNTLDIEIEPFSGYRIKEIQINGNVVDYINDENIVKEGNLVKIPSGYFIDMQENKHITVEFEQIPATVKVWHLEEGTEKVLYTTPEGIQFEQIDGYVNETYETKEKDIKYYELVKEKYPSNNTGTMTEEEIIVKYYYRKSTFNMKVEKEIEKITVNGEETTYSGNNKSAKVEIKYKEIDSTKVEVSYKIKVTNTEKVEGTVVLEEIIPEGFEFVVEASDERWKVEEGKFVLQTEEIKPGETKEYKVTLRWLQNEENKGQKVNTVKIADTENEAGYEETTKDDNEDMAIVEIKLEKTVGEVIDEIISNVKAGDALIFAVTAVVIAGAVLVITIKRRK